MMRKPHWRHAEHMRLLLTGFLAVTAALGIGAEFFDPTWWLWAHFGQIAFTLVWIWEL